MELGIKIYCEGHKESRMPKTFNVSGWEGTGSVLGNDHKPELNNTLVGGK